MSLAPARTVAPRSSSDPAVCCALARNLSKALRACSKLASAIDRISFGISKRARPSSLMVPLLFCVCRAIHSPVSPFAHLLKPVDERPRQHDAAPFGSLSWTLGRPVCNITTREPAQGFGRIHEGQAIKVSRGFGPLTDDRAVDLPLPASDTKVPLRLSFVWPPISLATVGQRQVHPV